MHIHSNPASRNKAWAWRLQLSFSRKSIRQCWHGLLASTKIKEKLHAHMTYATDICLD